MDVASDGACLFRAISVCTTGNEDKHLFIRSECIKYIKDHSDQFKEIVRVDPDENLPFEKYLAKIASPSALIGEYVLPVIATIVKKPVKVYYCQAAPRVYRPAELNDTSNKAVGDCVNILYCDIASTNAGHYKALVECQGN